ARIWLVCRGGTLRRERRGGGRGRGLGGGDLAAPLVFRPTRQHHDPLAVIARPHLQAPDDALPHHQPVQQPPLRIHVVLLELQVKHVEQLAVEIPVADKGLHTRSARGAVAVVSHGDPPLVVLELRSRSIYPTSVKTPSRIPSPTRAVGRPASAAS